MRLRALAALAALACGPGCKWLARTPAPPCFTPATVPLCVPRRDGWVADTSVPPPGAEGGGVVLRLVREGAIAGSPRVDVALEPTRPTPTAIEELLARNLQEMAALEAAGQIHIDTVDQARLVLGSTPAYRVHHEYTAGTGAAQVAVNQVSTLLVIAGRGVAVTAVGRVELFHPLAQSIQDILEGLRVLGEAAVPPPSPGSAAAPVDLGVLGGRPAAAP